MRQSINSLQSFSKISTVSQYVLPVSLEFCETLFKKVSASRDIEEVCVLADDIACEGYAMDEILNGLF